MTEGPNAAALLDPRRTPSRREALSLARTYAVRDAAPKELRALARALFAHCATALPVVHHRLLAAERPERAKLARLAADLTTPDNHAGVRLLVELARDKDLKTQLVAIQALSAHESPEVEEALLALWQEAPRPELLRALVRSLGKVGGDRTLQILASTQVLVLDPLGQKLLQRALLILRRKGGRLASSQAPPDAMRVFSDIGVTGVAFAAFCRVGLERFLVREANQLRSNAAKVLAPGIVLITGNIDKTNLQLAENVGIYLGQVPINTIDALATCLNERCAASEVRALRLGNVRFRIDFPTASRARVLALAQELNRRLPEWTNETRESPWILRIIAAEGGPAWAALIAKDLFKTRKLRRVEDHCAASHPTIAAALALVGEARSDDIVWDPFVGSGLELAARARLGPWQGLYGTDIDPRAIKAAYANLQAAGIENAFLTLGDSTQSSPSQRPTLIITNPPLGRRVQRGKAKALCATFLPHAAALLAPGGRLVWISPFPDFTASMASKAGLRAAERRQLDMGGFMAELQRFDRPNAR